MTTQASDTEDLFRLMRFFTSYPGIRFSRISLLNALETLIEQPQIERAMLRLIDKGVVKSYSEHNVPYYGLTDDRSLQLAMLNVVDLDREHWQGLLRQSCGNN